VGPRAFFGHTRASLCARTRHVTSVCVDVVWAKRLVQPCRTRRVVQRFGWAWSVPGRYDRAGRTGDSVQGGTGRGAKITFNGVVVRSWRFPDVRFPKRIRTLVLFGSASDPHPINTTRSHLFLPFHSPFPQSQGQKPFAIPQLVRSPQISSNSSNSWWIAR
jgi:hypothetical protein